MRLALSAVLNGQVLRTIDWTAQAAGPMAAATFLGAYAMTYANATVTRSLQLDANTLQTNITANQARFDLSSADAVVELLLEEAKVNPALDAGFSPRAMPSGWGGAGAGVTVTAAFANGPDFLHGGGALTACREVFTSGTAGSSMANHWVATIPCGYSVWVRSNTGVSQTFWTEYGPGPQVPTFQQTATTLWTRVKQNFNFAANSNFVPSGNRVSPFPALDLLQDCIQPEQGYVSSFMPADRTAGDQLSDALTNWIANGQLNVEFRFRPQAPPTFYTSDARLLTVKDIGGTVVSFVEISRTTGIIKVNLNGTIVTGNAVLWSADDVVDVFVSLGTGTASVAYRRNGGPCTSMIFTALAGAVSGNSISWFSNFGAQCLAGGYRTMTRYGANTQGPSWYDGGVNPPLAFDFTTQPLGRMSATAFVTAYPYFTFARSSAAGVVTGAASYDLTCAVDEPGFGSYDSTSKGLSLLETRTNAWTVSPHVLTPNGTSATVTPAFAAGPDGVVTASRVQSTGANQYSGFINALVAPNAASIWVKSNTGLTQNLSKFWDFNGTFSGPYPATTSWAWQWTDGCVSAHLLMPVASTATAEDVVADYAQVEANSKYATDPIIGTGGVRAPALATYSALNTWINSSGQLRMEIDFVPTGGSAQPSYAKMRLYECAASGDYAELDVASGIVTFSVGGVTQVLPNAIGWTNRRLLTKLFLEVGGSLPSRIFTQEGTNAPQWSGNGPALAAIGATGATSLLSSLARDKNVSGLLSKLRTYPIGQWPSWLPAVPFQSSSINDTNVIFVGDSITEGTSAISWVTQLAALVGGTGVGHKHTFVNTAFAGQSLANMAANTASQVAANLVPGKKNYVFLMGGVNDLGSSGATIFGSWTTWRDNVAAINVGGTTVDAMCMFTITPRGATRTANAFETNRQAFLSLVNGYAIPAKTFVLRQDADFILDKNNAAPASGSPAQGWTPPDFDWYVNDGNFIHPNNAGGLRIAGYAWQQLVSLP